MRRSALIKKRAIRAFCIAGEQRTARAHTPISGNVIYSNALPGPHRAAQFLMKC
jgi:hypothetical protein